MSKRAFDKISAGLKEVEAFMSGASAPPGVRVHIPAEYDIKAIRKKLGLTQAAFASRFGFNLASLRDWEQGRFIPDTASRAFLKVIAREPEAVARALDAA